jgi:hypothetical protein
MVLRMSAGWSISISALALAVTNCSWWEKDPVGPADRVHERWTQAQPGAARTKPVVVGDMAAFGTGNGQLLARRQTSGEVVWAATVSAESIDGDHLVERSGVVVAAARRAVHAVNATTGQRVWDYVTPVDSVDTANPQPGLVDGAKLDADVATVYVPAWGASVSALDLTSGALRWVWRPAAGTPHRTGATGVRVSGDTVLASVWHFLNTSGTLSESWLVALDRTSGRQLWTVVLPA